MKLVCYPSEILHTKTTRVEAFDARLKETARQMIEAMYACSGVGLAANQVGLPLRMCVINCDGRNPEGEMVLVNPEIIERREHDVSEEGCLSFPGIFIDLDRAESVTVKYQDLEGREHTIEADGLLARALQHEVDHLDGVWLADRMSMVQRLAHRRQLKMLEVRTLRAEEPDAMSRAEPGDDGPAGGDGNPREGQRYS